MSRYFFACLAFKQIYCKSTKLHFCTPSLKVCSTPEGASPACSCIHSKVDLCRRTKLCNTQTLCSTYYLLTDQYATSSLFVHTEVYSRIYFAPPAGDIITPSTLYSLAFKIRAPFMFVVLHVYKSLFSTGASLIYLRKHRPKTSLDKHCDQGTPSVSARGVGLHAVLCIWVAQPQLAYHQQL